MNAPAGQLARVQALVLEEPAGPGETGPTTAGWLRRLCRAAARSLPATGAGVSLMIEGGSQGVAAAADDTSELIEELQFTLGVGPCLEAFASRQPVLAPDLADGDGSRWPAYAAAAQQHGVQAVFAFPLQVGAARVGVLDVYRDQPGPLDPQALSLALTFADVALMTVLDGQAHAEAGRPPDGFDHALDSRNQLYQAQGMVMIQLGVSLEEAMVRLRAHAYATETRLADVARDIVDRKMVLE